MSTESPVKEGRGAPRAGGRRVFGVPVRQLVIAAALLAAAVPGALVISARARSSGADAAPGLVEMPAGKPAPTTAAEAAALRSSGVTWSNAEVRGHYLKLVAAIGPANARWLEEGLSAEERARRAFQMRREARVTGRAMMTEKRDVLALEERDKAKYGHPDGPTFDELVQRNQAKGLQGDAVFEAIVESAQRTNGAVNDMVSSK
jgi:hypothetical protein